jgi:hypothetical protein
MNDDQLVEAVTAPNQTIAAMWAEALEGQGIPAMVRTRDPLAATASIPSPLPCSIMVLRRDLARALTVLEDIVSGDTQ